MAQILWENYSFRADKFIILWDAKDCYNLNKTPLRHTFMNHLTPVQYPVQILYVLF
jgi:hypothetical protein